MLAVDRVSVVLSRQVANTSLMKLNRKNRIPNLNQENQERSSTYTLKWETTREILELLVHQ